MTPKFPFTPEILDALPEPIAELYRGLELKLLDEICSRLRVSGQLNEVTVQSIRALRSHGIPLDQIKKAIRDTENLTQKKLDALLDDVVARNEKYYGELCTLADVTRPQAMVDHEDIWAIYEQTKGELRNLTQSMGFMVREGRHMVMLPPAKVYQHVLDKATITITSGAFSYNQAIADAIKELADSGLRVINYESGHKDSVDTACRRAILTGVNQLNMKYREQSMDYLETDLVEISAHLGARNIPGPLGFEAHSQWQGKIYHWNREK